MAQELRLIERDLDALACLAKWEMGFGHFAALLVLLGLLQSSGAAFTWKPCPDVSSKGSISSVSLTPDPPYPGSTASFVVEGVAGRQP